MTIPAPVISLMGTLVSSMMAPSPPSPVAPPAPPTPPAPAPTPPAPGTPGGEPALSPKGELDLAAQQTRNQKRAALTNTANATLLSNMSGSDTTSLNSNSGGKTLLGG